MNTRITVIHIAIVILIAAAAGTTAAQLVVSPPRVIQGASANVFYYYNGNTVQNSGYPDTCTSAFYGFPIEISAAGEPCADPNELAYNPDDFYYCDQNTIVPGGMVTQPSTPCILNANYKDLGANGCMSYYFTNLSLLQGTYNVCAYYPEVSINGVAGFSITYEPYATLSLNITTSNYTGINYGLQINPSAQTWSGATTLMLSANTQTGTYQGFSSSFSICSSANSQCYAELGGANNAGEGCFSPLTQNGASTQLPQCSYTGASMNTPCLLAGAQSSSTQYSISLPAWISSTTSNYMVCAYQYNAISYPSGTQESNTVNPGNVHPYVSEFYATQPISCSSAQGSCTAGPSGGQEQQSVGVVAPGGFPYATMLAWPGPTINTTWQQTTGPYLAFNAFGFPVPAPYENYNAFVLYEDPVSSYSAVAQSGLQQACTDVMQSSPPTCSSAISSLTSPQTLDQPCYESYMLGQPTPYSYSCQIVGGSGADSCTSPALTSYGSGEFEQNLLSFSGTQNSVFQNLAVGNYLFCGLLTLPEQQPQLLSAIAVQIVPSTSPSAATSLTSPNNAPVLALLCNEYTILQLAILLIALALIVLGALLYIISAVFPAEQRGIVRSYSVSMILGGVIGLVVFVFATYFLSVLSSGTVSDLVIGSCSSVSGYGLGPPPSPSSPLEVTVNPDQQSIQYGQQATITATASGGYPSYNYQWYDNSACTDAISGASGPVLTAYPTSDTTYCVEVTDSESDTAEATAIVTVAPPPPPPQSPSNAVVYCIGGNNGDPTSGDNVFNPNVYYANVLDTGGLAEASSNTVSGTVWSEAQYQVPLLQGYGGVALDQDPSMYPLSPWLDLPVYVSCTAYDWYLYCIGASDYYGVLCPSCSGPTPSTISVMEFSANILQDGGLGPWTTFTSGQSTAGQMWTTSSQHNLEISSITLGVNGDSSEGPECPPVDISSGYGTLYYNNCSFFLIGSACQVSGSDMYCTWPEGATVGGYGCAQFSYADLGAGGQVGQFYSYQYGQGQADIGYSYSSGSGAGCVSDNYLFPGVAIQPGTGLFTGTGGVDQNDNSGGCTEVSCDTAYTYYAFLNGGTTNPSPMTQGPSLPSYYNNGEGNYGMSAPTCLFAPWITQGVSTPYFYCMGGYMDPTGGYTGVYSFLPVNTVGASPSFINSEWNNGGSPLAYSTDYINPACAAYQGGQTYNGFIYCFGGDTGGYTYGSQDEGEPDSTVYYAGADTQASGLGGILQWPDWTNVPYDSYDSLSSTLPQALYGMSCVIVNDQTGSSTS